MTQTNNTPNAVTFSVQRIQPHPEQSDKFQAVVVLKEGKLSRTDVVEIPVWDFSGPEFSVEHHQTLLVETIRKAIQRKLFGVKRRDEVMKTITNTDYVLFSS